MPRDAPAFAEGHELMTWGQRLLAVRLALAMIFAFSAMLWVWWDLVVR
jgi:hypothetical protein